MKKNLYALVLWSDQDDYGAYTPGIPIDKIIQFDYQRYRSIADNLNIQYNIHIKDSNRNIRGIGSIKHVSDNIAESRNVMIDRAGRQSTQRVYYEPAKKPKNGDEDPFKVNATKASVKNNDAMPKFGKPVDGSNLKTEAERKMSEREQQGVAFGLALLKRRVSKPILLRSALKGRIKKNGIVYKALNPKMLNDIIVNVKQNYGVSEEIMRRKISGELSRMRKSRDQIRGFSSEKSIEKSNPTERSIKNNDAKEKLLTSTSESVKANNTGELEGNPTSDQILDPNMVNRIFEYMETNHGVDERQIAQTVGTVLSRMYSSLNVTAGLSLT